MNAKFVLLGIATALVAGAESLREFAANMPDEDTAPLQPTVTPAAPLQPAAIADIELDASGLPWDARIHASTKTKTQKGIWTQKKGCDEAVRDAVVAELRQHYPDTSTVTPAAPSAPEPTVAAPEPTVAAPTVPTVPVVSAPVVAVLTPFQKLTDWLAKNTGPGKVLTGEWVNEVLASNGTSLAALATAPVETIAAFHEGFRTALAGTGTQEVL